MTFESRYSAVTGPEAMERQLAVGADEERLGNARRPELALGEVAASVAKLRIGDPVLADEAQRVAAEVVGVDPQDREAPPAVRAVEALQGRRLVAAGGAPGGPDVDQHPASAVVGDRAGALALELRKPGGRDRIAGLERLGALVQQAVTQQSDHREDGEEDREGASAHGREG